MIGPSPRLPPPRWVCGHPVLLRPALAPVREEEGELSVGADHGEGVGGDTLKIWKNSFLFSTAIGTFYLTGSDV